MNDRCFSYRIQPKTCCISITSIGNKSPFPSVQALEFDDRRSPFFNNFSLTPRRWRRYWSLTKESVVRRKRVPERNDRCFADQSHATFDIRPATRKGISLRDALSHAFLMIPRITSKALPYISLAKPEADGREVDVYDR